ncbi:MAG: Holliday junction resolvase RuvX [Defluviitaleaceae bacterium]|nr:Holliday junction resolvase RuvX [Defluviitaleaceae bacterium]
METPLSTKPDKYMGLDYGDKTIGVSIASGRVATGVTTIKKNPEEIRPALKELKKLIAHYNVTHIVLGNPKNLSGDESERSEKTKLFKEKLERYFKAVTVILWDERLSTKAVSRVFNGKKADYKKKVDQMAAIYILQGFIDNLKEGKIMSNEPIAWNDENEETEDIVLYNEDGDEIALQILASHEDERGMFVLAAEGEEDEAAHFKLIPADGDEDEIIFELVDEEHEDFEHVLKLFKEDYEALGIELE